MAGFVSMFAEVGEKFEVVHDLCQKTKYSITEFFEFGVRVVEDFFVFVVFIWQAVD